MLCNAGFGSPKNLAEATSVNRTREFDFDNAIGVSNSELEGPSCLTPNGATMINITAATAAKAAQKNLLVRRGIDVTSVVADPELAISLGRTL